jgi:gamma-glutamylcyclotransferase (GGCT)/AIG2-like uncharacterized protein YtfP
MNNKLLFVYGSMTEGMVHFEKIKDFICSIKPAFAKGSVYRMKIGYPAMSLLGQDSIFGQLLELNVSEVMWHLLDGFFGYNSQEPMKSLFLKEYIYVMSGDQMHQAWVYVLNNEKNNLQLQLIEGGDWEAAMKVTPPLTEKLTERQRNYVLKLGSSSGREIVPIDMNLYRELLSLEIIVDKGRRLALSKLGVELYKMLVFG